MKKLIATLLALVMVLGLFACAKDTATDEPKATDAPTTEATTLPEEDGGLVEGAMTYAEYAAAEMESEVTVACYVQATQSWWDNKITVYAADADGAYFIYEMACSEEDSKKLTPGTKIKVTGVKGAWAGEIEIMDAKFEFVEGADKFVAPAKDLTDKIASEDLINYQNQLVTFKGLTIKKVEYKNGQPGDDIYITVTKDGKDYNFCIEVYLTGKDTTVYSVAGQLEEGHVVDITAYLYWYEGMNPHIVEIICI